MGDRVLFLVAGLQITTSVHQWRLAVPLVITLRAPGIAALERKFASAARALPVAIARGLNQGGDKARTQIQRALQQQTGLLRYGSVTQRVRTRRAFPGQFAYILIGSSYPSTKPDEFRFKATTGPGGGVTIDLWGTPHRLARSFVIKGRPVGPGALRARIGAPRKPIRGFDGPNIAKELIKDRSAAAFAAAAPEVQAAILRNIAGLLG
jgi:hypothetical protein